MPIITIECVLESDIERYDSGCAQRLADKLGKTLKSDPGTTWVKLAYLDRSNYAENETVIDDSVKPTFVSILLRSLPSEKVLEELSQKISKDVAEILSRPLENTHVLFEPEGFGRVAFGGNLVNGPTSQEDI